MVWWPRNEIFAEELVLGYFWMTSSTRITEYCLNQKLYTYILIVYIYHIIDIVKLTDHMKLNEAWEKIQAVEWISHYEAF